MDDFDDITCEEVYEDGTVSPEDWEDYKNNDFDPKQYFINKTL